MVFPRSHVTRKLQSFVVEGSKKIVNDACLCPHMDCSKLFHPNMRGLGGQFLNPSLCWMYNDVNLCKVAQGIEVFSRRGPGSHTMQATI